MHAPACLAATVREQANNYAELPGRRVFLMNAMNIVEMSS